MQAKARLAWGCGCVALVVALPAAHARAGAGRVAAADPGVTATRSCSARPRRCRGRLGYGRGRARRRGVLPLRERARRRQRPHDRLRSVDDAYDPAQTLAGDPRARRAGTASSRSSAPSAPRRGSPRATSSTRRGCRSSSSLRPPTTFGRDTARYPWTIGFGPSDRAEGWIFGRYLARLKPGSRVGVLSGRRRGRRESWSPACGSGSPPRRSADASRRRPPRSRSCGRRARPCSRSSSPSEAATSGRRARGPARLAAARPHELGGSPRPGAAVSARRFVKDPAEPRWSQDPACGSTARSWRATPAARTRATSVTCTAWPSPAATVEVLERAGRNLTRAGLLARARTLHSVSNPFLLPGIEVRTGPADGFPIEQAQLRRWTDGAWRSFGGLWRSGA